MNNWRWAKAPLRIPLQFQREMHHFTRIEFVLMGTAGEFQLPPRTRQTKREKKQNWIKEDKNKRKKQKRRRKRRRKGRRRRRATWKVSPSPLLLLLFRFYYTSLSKQRENEVNCQCISVKAAVRGNVKIQREIRSPLDSYRDPFGIISGSFWDAFRTLLNFVPSSW